MLGIPWKENKKLQYIREQISVRDIPEAIKNMK